MIEAVIVISTMLIFLGLIVWTRQAYGMKLDMQQRTRSDVLYYASHGCTDSGGGIGRIDGGGAIPGDDNPAANVAGRSNLPDSAAMNRNWNTASGTLSGTANWQAVWDQNARGQNAPISYGRLALTSRITAATQVTCNEKKYPSVLTAWAKLGIDMLKGRGDFAALFH